MKRKRSKDGEENMSRKRVKLEEEQGSSKLIGPELPRKSVILAPPNRNQTADASMQKQKDRKRKRENNDEISHPKLSIRPQTLPSNSVISALPDRHGKADQNFQKKRKCENSDCEKQKVKKSKMIENSSKRKNG